MTVTLTQTQQRFLSRHLGWTAPASAGAAVASGVVKKRKYLITRWQTLQKSIAAELDKLCNAIPDRVPFEDPEEIRGAVDAAMRPFLQEMMEQIQEAIDISVNSGDHSYAAVKRAVASARALCARNDMVAALCKNTLTDGSGFAAALLGSLDDIEKRLTT